MHNPLSARLRLWGERATNGEHVIIFVADKDHGGREGAQKFARRMTVSFANIRRSERAKADRRVRAQGVQHPQWEAPFEAVTAISFRSIEGYDVHFMPETAVDDLFTEVKIIPGQGRVEIEPTAIDNEITCDNPMREIPREPDGSVRPAKFDWAADLDPNDDPFGDEDASALDNPNERE